jgi:hypothetical protein
MSVHSSTVFSRIIMRIIRKSYYNTPPAPLSNLQAPYVESMCVVPYRNQLSTLHSFSVSFFFFLHYWKADKASCLLPKICIECQVDARYKNYGIGKILCWLGRRTIFLSIPRHASLPSIACPHFSRNINCHCKQRGFHLPPPPSLQSSYN